MRGAPKYMLDTDICIFVQREEQPSVLARFEQLLPGEAVVSTITFGELFFGALKSQRTTLLRRQLDDFIALVPVVPMPTECGKHYGAIRSDLQKRGLPIGNNDIWIAAHALALNLILVTNNTREFERIPRLKVENWI